MTGRPGPAVRLSPRRDDDGSAVAGGGHRGACRGGSDYCSRQGKREQDDGETQHWNGSGLSVHSSIGLSECEQSKSLNRAGPPKSFVSSSVRCRSPGPGEVLIRRGGRRRQPSRHYAAPRQVSASARRVGHPRPRGRGKIVEGEQIEHVDSAFSGSSSLQAKIAASVPWSPAAATQRYCVAPVAQCLPIPADSTRCTRPPFPKPFSRSGPMSFSAAGSRPARAS